MLYFDDFMEAIENLPSELNESLTNVRQLDLQAQSIMDSISESVRAYFEGCKVGKYLEYEKSTQQSNIAREYECALSHCKDKREIVENIYNTYRKLVRKLDIELEKFRLELEADNSGITEQIETKVHTLLGKAVNTTSKTERRRQRFRFPQSAYTKNPISVRKRLVDQAFRTAFKSASMRPLHLTCFGGGDGGLSNSDTNSNPSISNNEPINDQDLILHINPSDDITNFANGRSSVIPDAQINERAMEFAYDSMTSRTSNTPYLKTDDGLSMSSTNQRPGDHFQWPTTSKSVYLLQDSLIDAKCDNFVKGQVGPTNCRVMKVNSSTNYTTSEATLTNDDKFTTPRSLTQDSEGEPTNVSWPHVLPSLSNSRERRRAPRRFDRLTDDLSIDEIHKMEDTSSLTVGLTPERAFDDQSFEMLTDTKTSNLRDQFDDEDCKRYCICRDVSYGDMIACDAPDCPFEWFHYGCVNLTVAPKGRWFCPTCTKSNANKRSIKKHTARK